MTTIKIAGGIGKDDNLTVFGDFINTLERMRKELNELQKEQTYNNPHQYTIISNGETYFAAASNRNIKQIAVKYAKDCDFDNVIVTEMAVNERDYILSRDWITDWWIRSGDSHSALNYLLLTDGTNVIQTGKSSKYGIMIE